jgi:methylated-DNA-protein-cysteine methyltransferase related protein
VAVQHTPLHAHRKVVGKVWPTALPAVVSQRLPVAGGSKPMAKPGGTVRFKSRVLAVVAAIPSGRVTTYGTIARHLGIRPRQVAFILGTLTVEESKQLPWFRVVAANGIVSSTKLGAVGRRQIARLRAEGVAVTPRNKVEDFHLIAWSPS